MKLLCIQHSVSRHFLKLGSIIGKHPYYFLLGTLMLTAVLSTGLFKIKINREINVLFTVKNGRAQTNKNVVKKIFPMNTTSFADILRNTDIFSTVSVQIVASDGGSVLRKNVIGNIVKLDNYIRNITINWNNRSWNYEDLCGKRNGKCLQNSFYKIKPFANEIIEGKYKIKYPVDINNVTFLYNEYASSLGGVELDNSGNLKDAKAVRFIYLIDVSDPLKKELLPLWEKTLNEYLRSFPFDELEISFYNDISVLEAFKSTGTTYIKRIPIAATIVIIFSFFSCFTNNWIRSKPWLGPSACVSAGLAIISGFGFACFIGIEYTDFHIGLCFVVFGTEIDDAFVMISAWRNTSVNDNVENRMKKVYSEVGVCITITSVTNLISFCIGTTTGFPVVKLFCGYAACCAFFTYVYQIAFFGACMALSGYREEKKLHPLTFRPINDKLNSKEFHQGRINKEEEFLMAKFRDKIGNLLTFLPIKIVIIILFLINISIGIYGFIHIEKGSDFSDVFRHDSSVNIYNKLAFKYFSKYYYPIHVVIDKPLNYADPEIQKTLNEVFTMIESHQHISVLPIRISWLNNYKRFSNMPIGKFALKGYNISDKQDFIDGLRSVFLRFPQAEEFKQDVIFNKNFTEIIASRFIFLLKDISNHNIEFSVLKDLYKIADKSPIPMKIYSILFHLTEHAILIENIVYDIILITSILLCLIFFLFVPNIICVLAISTIVVCIVFETVGYAYFLNVKMDLLLLYSLVLCVGFSINYPTHISFSFIVATNRTQEERLKSSIYDIGLPIIQGVITTILSIIVFTYDSVQSSLSFFKIMSILSLQTVFHAMFAIPVILSIILQRGKSQNEVHNFVSDIDIQTVLNDDEN